MSESKIQGVHELLARIASNRKTADRGDSNISSQSRTSEIIAKIRDRPAVTTSSIVDAASLGIVAESKRWIVVQVGQAYTICGISGEPAPRHIIPTPPITRDNVRAVIAGLVHYICYALLLASPSERRVAVVTDPLAPEYIANVLADTLRTKFKVPAVAMVPGPPAAIIAVGLKTALVVDCGHTDVRVVPVVHGHIIPHAWRTVGHGGAAALSWLSERLAGKGAISLDVLEDTLHRACFIPSATPASQASTVRMAGVDVDKDVRGGALEALFTEAAGPGDMGTLPEAIVAAVMDSPIDSRRELLGNIVLCGGLARVRGLAARLMTEVTKRLGASELQGCEARVVRVHGDPQTLAWQGAALLASMPAIDALVTLPS